MLCEGGGGAGSRIQWVACCSQGELSPPRVIQPHYNKKLCLFYKEKMQPSSRFPKLEPLPSALLDKQIRAVEERDSHRSYECVSVELTSSRRC